MTTISNLPLISTASFTDAVIFPVVAGTLTNKASLAQLKTFIGVLTTSTLKNGSYNLLLDQSGQLNLPNGALISDGGQYLYLRAQEDNSVLLRTNAAGQGNKDWVFTPNGSIYFPNSTIQTSAWTGTVTYSNVTGKPNTFYTLPTASTSTVGGVAIDGNTITINTVTNAISSVLKIASTSTLGGVKVDGTTITINSSTGVISGANTYELPIASDTILGGIKVGSGLTIDGTGVLRAGAITSTITSGTTFILNAAETQNYVSTNNGLAGLYIVRGEADGAGVFFNDNYYINDGTTSSRGIFILSLGTRLTGVGVDYIRVNTGTSELNVFGADNPTSVISVKGTTNYETQVVHDDHIPNKKYVDNAITNSPVATTSTFGVVKIGSNITVDNGVISAVGGGGGSSTLSGLTDVTISSVSDGQVLKYSTTAGKWVNGTDNTSGGGGGLVSRSSANVTTITLTAGASTSTNITGFKGYALLSIQTSAAAWVTVYSSTAARTADLTRTITSDPTPGSGVIAEVITTSGTTQYFSPALIGYSSESSPSTTIPIKVYNNGASSAAITVTLTLIQLEA
jgi:hypothetical protein